jgi:DNA-binding LytR/AlgR family response regulator
VSAALRVLIADDEPLARQRLRRLLRREAEVEVVAECADGPATVAGLMSHAPDLLFLDVQMPELDGFAVLQAIPADLVPVTIFVTAYDQYALRAFDAQALDYLLKPYTEARFRTAFARGRAAVQGPEPGERARLLSLLEQIRLEQRDCGRPCRGRSRAWPTGCWCGRRAGCASCPRPRWTGSRRPATPCGCTRARRCMCCGSR